MEANCQKKWVRNAPVLLPKRAMADREKTWDKKKPATIRIGCHAIMFVLSLQIGTPK